MITLFKGQLSLDDILNKLPYKILSELRDRRQDALLREQKELEAMNEEAEKNKIRESILAK